MDTIQPTATMMAVDAPPQEKTETQKQNQQEQVLRLKGGHGACAECLGYRFD
jgi:hypothetical protein